jgi:uncharacterized repeat protein (TIGR03803 family)
MSAMRISGIFLMLGVLWVCSTGPLIAAQSNVGTDPGTTFTSLFSFDGADGEFPSAALIQGTDGNLYGTTVEGGANCPPLGCGTIFKVTPSGTLTTLHSFDGADGTEPHALVQATNGNFYGTTAFGGANGDGTVFEITPGGTLTTLASFNVTDGANPEVALIQATDGNFYGTTSKGGANTCTAPSMVPNSDAHDNQPPRKTVTCGTVFRITPGGMLTTLASFGPAGGSDPFSPLIQATDGNFYGTTPDTVFAAR